MDWKVSIPCDLVRTEGKLVSVEKRKQGQAVWLPLLVKNRVVLTALN